MNNKLISQENFQMYLEYMLSALLWQRQGEYLLTGHLVRSIPNHLRYQVEVYAQQYYWTLKCNASKEVNRKQ